MANFNEILSKVISISNSFTEANKDAFKEMFKTFDALEEDLKASKARARDKSQKDKNPTHLQRIVEDETDSPKIPEVNCDQQTDTERLSNESGDSRRSKKRSKHEVEDMQSPEQEKRQKRNASVKAQSIISKQVNVNLNQKLRRENSSESERRRRGKEDDKENTVPSSLGIVKIKQEKISNPPMPEPEPEPMEVLSTEATLPSVVVKQEANKDNIAMPPPLAPGPKSRKGLQRKSEDSTDDETPGSRRGRRTRKQTDTMPAPPESRKGLQEEKSEDSTDDESNRSRRGRRTRKQTDTMPAPYVRASRSRRGSAAKQSDAEQQPPADTRPKRTRAKKAAETTNTNGVDESQTPVENGIASPAEKPRPKRTRRAQKQAEKETEKAPEPTQPLSKPDVTPLKEERISKPNTQSPVLPVRTKQNTNTDKTKETSNIPIKIVTKHLNNNHDSVNVEQIQTKNTKNANKNHEDSKTIEDKINGEMTANINDTTTKNKNDHQEDKDVAAKNKINSNLKEINSNLKEMNSNLKEINSNLRETVCEDVTEGTELEKTSVLGQLDATVTISKDLDQTMVLPQGVYNHAPITPVAVGKINSATVLQHNRETVVLDQVKPQQTIINSTVVLEKDAKPSNLTDDNSLLTDDSDATEVQTPPKKTPLVQPTSAVKEKVQQFEELASRVTRTKTRALAKKEEQTDEHTPPDKVSKAVLSNETLAKMNNMIFSGKQLLVSRSASKPRAATPSTKSSLVSASTSKLSGINKAREADELRCEREDARRKKEALLDAKREAQRRKREEKMAAAAAAREAAERERRAALEAAVRERMEKQAHADLGKLERLKEAERKKQETARKVAETEERRRADEQARRQRLADEQRRADELRRKQQEEAEALKKEMAIAQKEVERRQKEYMEKQRMKLRMATEKMNHHKNESPRALAPVYMQDGFQQLNSDDSDDDNAPAPPPPPAWALPKARTRVLRVQERVRCAVVDRLYSVREHSPDLRDIFPNIERARLKRTSSAVWRTPPPRLPVLTE